MSMAWRFSVPNPESIRMQPVSSREMVPSKSEKTSMKGVTWVGIVEFVMGGRVM